MNRTLIYGLLLSILMVILPHANHLPAWVIALCAGLFAWRGYLNYSGNPQPARWLLSSITIGALGATFVTFHTFFGREVGVTMLALLASLKLLELKTQRDAMMLIYLSCFIAITNFFYSQSLTTGLYLFATLFIITLTWVYLHAPGSALRPRIRIAASLLLQAIPLTAILFVLFPRIQGPLWGLPQDAYASSGLDDKMSPGSLGHLALSDAVAFRVSFQGKVPRRDQMYWRGPVLWRFDGKTWTSGTGRSTPPVLATRGLPIDYSVTLEPHNKTWLFALDMPDKISVPFRLTSDFQPLSLTPIDTRLHYQARSWLEYRTSLQEVPLQRALQLPPTPNPKSRELAASWRSKSDNDAEVIRHALNYFHEQDFHYTLEPMPLGINGIDDFLFNTRQGFCEHYASAFVFLMRAAGIPARVVTGYQGGELNALGNYYIVRQSDAHAWAEVWLTGQGWTRIDPTASIAPERVEKGLSAALTNRDALPLMVRARWLRDLAMNMDAISYRWNQWIIGYDSELQFDFLNRIGMGSLNWQQIALEIVTDLGIIIGLIALLMLRHPFKRETDQTQAAWLILCKKLGRAGLPRPAHEGPRDYALRIAALRPDLSCAIQDLAARYLALRYGTPVQSDEQFTRLVAKFSPSRNKRDAML